MSALPRTDAVKFGKIIGLLASNHDGERATAALKATEFLRAREMGWGNVAEAMVPVPAVRSEPLRASARPRAEVRSHHQRRAMAMLLTAISAVARPTSADPRQHQVHPSALRQQGA